MLGMRRGFGAPQPARAPMMLSYNPSTPPAMMRPPQVLRSFKKGGKVKKTGNYKLHKGEMVVPLSKLRSK